MPVQNTFKNTLAMLTVKNPQHAVSFTLLFLLVFMFVGANAQHPALRVQKYVLENGFTVYLNEDKTAKEVFGAIVVKAGSKNDPADATGIAHYLEHLLFKGTTQLGTTDFQKEKIHLDSINFYYDLLGKTTDKAERSRIQQLINNQSVQAAKYGLPTEFDKLIKSIGGTGLNAFTMNDMTVYHNAFPGEQMEKWLELYSHRFQQPVFRSFQSELEVVYEEKNIDLDEIDSKLIEEMNKHLFKFHPYGTQTTLGSVEHLKNPSLTKMYEYFNTYYVANNMSLVLCGNFDAADALLMIKEKFSKLRTGKIPEFPKYPETVFKKKEILTVRYSPVRVALMGYKTVPRLHEDNAALLVFNQLLSNSSETGRLDKLRRDGKLLAAAGMNYSFNDDGAVMLIAVPKLIGQSIKQAEKLVFAEIEKIKNGEISDTDLQITKTQLYIDWQSELENYGSRTMAIVGAIGSGTTWEERLKYSEVLQRITKEDVVRVARKYFNDNYFALHSRTGFPKKHKLQKPGYKPVLTDQKEESEYAKNFKKQIAANKEPRFLDFEKDATLLQLNSSNKLYVTPNPINDIFNVTVQFMVGSDSIRLLKEAADLLPYFYTKNLGLDQLKREFALLGLTYYASCSKSRFSLTFTGIERNLQQSLVLINGLINQAQVDEKSIEIIIRDLLAERKISEKDPSTLGYALYEYARYKNRSEFIDRLTEKELKKLKAAEVLSAYKKAITYSAVWHYVGIQPVDSIRLLFNSNIALNNANQKVPLTYLVNSTSTQNIIYLLNDKKAVQSHIYFLVNSELPSQQPSTVAGIYAFNEYMDGGFSGLIMQEIREYRSLAYSTYGWFANSRINKSAYFYSYIGCQADKTNESIVIMDSLINHMPRKPERMDDIKTSLKKGAAAFYPAFRYISGNIEYGRQLGDTSSIMKAVYPEYDHVTFDAVEKFYEQYIKNRPVIITIYGDKSKMDLARLSKYAKIIELKKSDIISH
jgi:zinc protease